MGAAASVRMRVRVEGTVQGVGFRPFVYRLATDLGLGGWVRNDERGVLLEVEGGPSAVESFLTRLRAEAPPLAVVEAIQATPCPPSNSTRSFAILVSEAAAPPDALVSPDSATCPDCLAELFDPGDRRYRYPFVNCTNCGPRFTIVKAVPYDRSRTTMAGFAMCEQCQAEYDDPRNRRFHAEPNACPACGPRVVLAHTRGGGAAAAHDPITRAAAALLDGRIVAVKGVGGYHLACRADDEAVVARLRARKRREDKPFALMAPSLDAARALVELSRVERELLQSRARPIVIARRQPGAAAAPSVAPGSPDLGVMLPYSPLHHLLLRDAGIPLVLTSGNASDEPIAYQDADAAERLGPIADLLLSHDRPIHMRTDDSVLRATTRRPLLVRRSRGYVPESLDLPLAAEQPLLACGAELKSTFCVAKGRRAWVSHHIGDLKNWETLRSFRAGIEHFERIFAVTPRVIVHDLHPDYLSTAYAAEREGVELVGVQHHHAHLAACLAEHGETGPAAGAIYDGAGYGPDGTVWGGELLVGDVIGYERIGHLHPVRLPGGDRAAAEPWRMACAWLLAAGEDVSRPPPTLTQRVDPDRWDQVVSLCRSGTAAPVTTSAGRLFDAIAALCGLRTEITYEGQAAIELEGTAALAERSAYPLPLTTQHPTATPPVTAPPPSSAASRFDRTETPSVPTQHPALLLDARPTISAALRDLAAGMDVPRVAARFHNALADATATACARAAEARGLAMVVLSGGVFQNRLLLERTVDRLDAAGLRVLIPERLPPGDGGISYGQAAVAAGRGARR